MKKGNNMERKVTAGFEIALMMVSLFAFCYFVGFTEDVFPLVLAAEDGDDASFQKFLDKFNVRGNDFSGYPVASEANDIGCCLVAKDSQVCGTADTENCIGNSPFAEGALCSETGFCEKGCCYDDLSGTYDKNVLELACAKKWVKDPNCNLPEAVLGCCILGSETLFETEGQCGVDSLARATGNRDIIDWNPELNEGACLLLSASQEEGACIMEGGVCKIKTDTDCLSSDGNFYAGLLCSAKSLNTGCVMSEQTQCVEGKDGVYFVDSCGNVANIYDSSRAIDETYWEKIVEDKAICGDSDVEGGNGGSKSCGNCNRFAGGICASAEEDNFNVDVGGFYCRDTSCMFDGENYENGESWCVYDGTIGDSNDVVGSRHWKYVCSQGVVQVEPCADYRNQICIQSDSFEHKGKNVDFNNAVCVVNNWRECVALNAEGDEDAILDCQDTLNCRVDTIDIADKFKIDVCLPKYPGGFSFTEERSDKTSGVLCGMANLNCTVVLEEKTWGGCKYIANENCLTGTFAEEMNDFCRGLGDCGGSANILGEYSESYKVKRDGAVDKSMFLSDGWVAQLKALANEVDGQFAEVEDYSEYLEAAGAWGKPGATPGVEGEDSTLNTAATGVSGIGTAASWAAGTAFVQGGGIGSLGTASFISGNMVTGAQVSTTYLSAFGSVAIGAGMGMAAGIMLAKSMGVSPGGTMLMAVGGAMVGGALAAMYIGLIASGPVGWAVAIVGAIIMIIGALFAGDDCDPVVISFDCKKWEAPRGGADCEKCNGDPLKPCSEYRCGSLGARCELINEGSEDELCIDGNPHDVNPPILSRDKEFEGEGAQYVDNSNGFRIVGENDGCLEAYAPITFALSTSEPAQCKFDIEGRNFEEMAMDIGGGSYLYNHSISINLPDVGHVQNMSINWSGDLNFFVSCIDRSGLTSPGIFKVDMCIAKGPDLTPPRIISGKVGDNGAVGFDAESAKVEIVTNEPADCKWELKDVDYSEMGNLLSCSDSVLSPSSPIGYTCRGVLDVTGNFSGEYYVRCADQPWKSEGRNVNMESFILRVKKPDSKISIDSISPSEDFEIGTELTTIALRIETSGGGNSHLCSYSFSGYDNMIKLFETGGNRVHSQILNRGEGVNKIYVECVDESGDFDRAFTEFEIIRDSSFPAIARVWQSGTLAKVALTDEGECRFSKEGCRFVWSEGVDIGSGNELEFEVSLGEKYYVKCRDEYGNAPSGCTITLRAL